jgi:GntR family transcriptional regulator
MPKELVTAEEVMQAMMHRITTGIYAPGDRLPSVRDLALELGSNRNTVNKAYQMLLELGVIVSNASGRRGFSVKDALQAGPIPKNELLDYFYQQAVNLVWQGMAAGIPSNLLLEQLKTAVGDVYGHGKVRLIFFECNEYDTREMGRGLNEALGYPVEYRVLDHFYADPAQIVMEYDLIITTYHHLAEITEAIKTHGQPPGKVVGIETRPTAETMLRVARLPNPRIGLVCTIQNTVHMLKHIFMGYHPEWEIEAACLDDPEIIKEIARNCEHLIVTHTCAAEVTALTGRSPDVVVIFQIDEQSIAYIKQRVYAIQMEHMKPLHALT